MHVSNTNIEQIESGLATYAWQLQIETDEEFSVTAMEFGGPQCRTFICWHSVSGANYIQVSCCICTSHQQSSISPIGRQSLINHQSSIIRCIS